MSVSAGQDDNQKVRDDNLNDLCDNFMKEAEIVSVDVTYRPSSNTRLRRRWVHGPSSGSHNDHLGTLSFLLENGADPNARGKD
ncbi:hypothetical protein KIN20_029524 [Parelaphostrongylus tenuis]|uniref:Uncharacterized protein n=1 Tax=Parelaphostrongylus tenuis TaxID=148309 RepID=A0AAD5NDE3_PARTN|nr:hypothetical protein KIN20_025572 [Parelaphostrongylus tenuis]KAJ1368400.1 hypothetical protein KIN20_029524 [Parelaphostrongylus tenuis]